MTARIAGMRPRPEPDPVVVSLVSAVLDQLWAEQQAAASLAAAAGTDAEVASQAWRFSGRWWARPLPVRRHRPWIR